MHHAFKLGDADINLELARSARGYRLHLADRELNINLATAADGSTWLSVGDRHVPLVIATLGDQVFVHVDGEAHELRYLHPLTRLAAAAQGGADDHIRAPMPGSIVSVSIAAGDSVTRGQTLLVMESMKMETTITAPRDGVIDVVSYGTGQTFERDALLLSLKAQEAKS